MKMIICEGRQPALTKLVGVIHSELGVRPPRGGYFLIPAKCGIRLKDLESTAALLSTTHPAPEDRDAAEAILAGEAPRYLDSEMSTFAVGDPSVAEAIAARLDGGWSLLRAVECITEFVREGGSGW